jgi:hypothetical protein
VAARIVVAKLVDNRREGHFKIKQATFIKQRGHGGGRDHFGDGSEIEDGLGHDLGGIGFISGTTEGLQSHQFVALRDSQRGGRKRASRNRVPQNRKSRRELNVLTGKGGDEMRKRCQKNSDPRRALFGL